jgi:hypothetical protein
MGTEARISMEMLRTSGTEPSGNGIIRPGDLSLFTPYGESFYGYQEGIRDPFKEAPITNAEGGILCFPNHVSREDFQALSRIIGVNDRDLDYNVILQTSDDPRTERYLTQMRLVSGFALKFLFQDSQEADAQKLNMTDAMWAFMEKEKSKYGTMFGNPAIAGTLGGDGHFEQEELAFGIAVENPYYHVYRIWSRPWLVGK